MKYLYKYGRNLPGIYILKKLLLKYTLMSNVWKVAGHTVIQSRGQFENHFDYFLSSTVLIFHRLQVYNHKSK